MAIPTGIRVLDSRLDGGIPEGSLVCVYANPLSMPEAFLYSFASVKKTYYINTSRPSEHVRSSMISMGFNPKVEFIDVFKEYYLGENGQFVIEDTYRDTRIFDFVGEVLGKISDNDCTIIVDNFSFFLNLRVSKGLKEWLLMKLYNLSKQLRNAVYIYVIKNVHSPDIASLVIDVSDVVFDLDVEKIGDKIYRRLAIPKIRGRTPFIDTFRYYVGIEGVVIDTSRDIA
ncbi:RAD55 family ATPase [Archaeoglobus profundus]|uniref:RecA-superfamily ATPase implicated in signal transduction-like protein n=1 Tax=Archaeoglobus profundus (strain DSM 5631 / JCM 9629 / NBRC 100127 / Av18) TaxID=572546 RepID=D2RHL1_ARCPA|nr:RAD55 family ATPase [Archaeoglobus profundus]ADB57786.1 RecA-superfamily ATPase implicated in signal transduction-like protein [Archaeoglobus profundus DSM 5631]